MKSELEIRRHRDHLRIAITTPCNCHGTKHEESCYRGMMMMQAVQQTLSWALGENEDLQAMVDRMAKDVTAAQRVN